MTHHVQIKVMPLKDLLDPQGKAVMSGLESLQFTGIKEVRVGKHISLNIEADSAEAARNIADKACKQLLANPVMEYYEIEMVD